MAGFVQVIIDDSTNKVITGQWEFDRENGGTLICPAGTSFPTSPVDGEWFWRTDESKLYRYNGSSWDPLEAQAAVHAIGGSRHSSSTLAELNALLSDASLVDPAQLVVVAESGGDFTSIKSAVDSIADAGPTKPYLVRVMPGVYAEDPITMKSYVTVAGAALGPAVVTPNDNSNPLFTAVSENVLKNLLVTSPPTNSSVFYIGAGVERVLIRDCQLNSGGYRGIHADGSLSTVFAERCRIFGMTQGVVATGGGSLNLDGTYLEDCTTAVLATGSGSQVVGCTLCVSGGTNGLYADDGGFVFVSSARTEGPTNAVRIGSSGSGSKVRGAGLSLAGGTTWDVLQESASGIVELNACKLRAERLSAVDWSNIHITYDNDEEGEQAFITLDEFNVGQPESARSSDLGEGGPYRRGVVVLTTDSTAGPSSDGGNLVDVSDEAKSGSGSTFSFQGTAAGHSILFGAELDDLKHWGLFVKQTTAAVEATKRSFIWEVWDGSSWVEFNVMDFSATDSYRYANEVFIRANSEEYISYGLTDDSSWEKKTIDGHDLYWSRVRITDGLTTAPVFEQTKLLPNFLEIAGTGTALHFGRARFRRTLVSSGNVFGESGGVTNSDQPVGSGGVPTGWDHNMKNCGLNGDGDAIYYQFTLPRGIDTSQPLNFRVVYVSNGGGTTGSFIMSVLPVEVEGVLEADPAGGIEPVARTLANCEKMGDKAGQTNTQSAGVSDPQEKLQRMKFDGFDISNYYEGDEVFVRFEADDLDGGAIGVMSMEASGVQWTHGDRI